MINQSLAGVVEAIHDMPAVDKLLGAKFGVRGVIEEDFIELKGISSEKIETIAETPSAALGSTRDKPDSAYCERIFHVFEKHNIRYFFYIGGNDSADTARIVGHLAGEAGYELRIFHIPKTIDNDLCATDHCPGYGSAARFVACALAGDDRDNAALPGVKIDVVMGRHAGWLAAASTLARRHVSDGPHLVYMPERRIEPDQMLADVEAVLTRFGRCVVVVSEGIEDRQGVLWGQKIIEPSEQEQDAHGNVQLSGRGALGDYIATLVKAKLGVGRVRSDTFGYLQRCFAGFASEVDEAEARLAGNKAVEYAMSGDISGSVAFKRTGNGADYGVECFLADLQSVARLTRVMPDEFIADNGHDVTEAFAEYALPLTGGVPRIAKLY